MLVAGALFLIYSMPVKKSSKINMDCFAALAMTAGGGQEMTAGGVLVRTGWVACAVVMDSPVEPGNDRAWEPGNDTVGGARNDASGNSL